MCQTMFIVKLLTSKSLLMISPIIFLGLFLFLAQNPCLTPKPHHCPKIPARLPLFITLQHSTVSVKGSLVLTQPLHFSLVPSS